MAVMKWDSPRAGHISARIFGANVLDHKSLSGMATKGVEKSLILQELVEASRTAVDMIDPANWREDRRSTRKIGGYWMKSSRDEAGRSKSQRNGRGGLLLLLRIAGLCVPQRESLLALLFHRSHVEILLHHEVSL